MKKLSVLFSLLVLSALVLSACGSADNSDNGTPGAVGTPGVVATDSSLVGTPTVDTGAGLATATVAAPVESTPTVGTDTAATPEGTGTAQSDVPVTGNQCVYNRTDNLLDYEVLDTSGAKVGDVEAVLVQRDVAFVADEDALEDGAANTTPQATEAATPAAGDAAAAPSGAAPRVQYVVVDLENNDTDVLVPFGAFNLTSMGDSPDSCGMNLAVDAAVVTGAPAFKADDLNLNMAGWDDEFNTYWAGQSLPNAAAAAELGGTPVMLDDESSDVPVRNTNGDDLGEAEDFIFNPQTGELTYADLASGGFLGLGEKHIPVPMNRVQWAYEDAEDAQEVDELGYLVINVNEDAWKNAPAFDDMNDLDTTAEGWDKDIVTYWNNLTD